MTDHDHSGDRLGADEPVASVHTDSITIDRLDLPTSYVVSKRDGHWFGFRTETQNVEIADEDGVAVINEALEMLDEQGVGGSVHVTAPAGGVTLESSTPISQTIDGTHLTLENGVTFRYTGDKQAVLLAGDGVTFAFDRVVADNARYVVRDLGLTNARVRGHELSGSSDSLWLSDAENLVHGTDRQHAGTTVWIQRLECEETTRRGVVVTSAPDAEIARYEWTLPAVVGPTETGIRIGDGTDNNAAHEHTVTAGVFGEHSDADLLVEFNDSRNALYLETYSPAGGDWDVVVRKGATDSFVQAYTRRDALRLKREARLAADLTRFDPVNHEVFDIELRPESLAGYETVGEGGSTRIRGGAVVHETSDGEEGRTGIQKRLDYNFGRSNFDNPAVLETVVEADAVEGQRAWLLWGGHEGPGIGWHVEDDTLYGFANDGRGSPQNAATTSLLKGFDSRSAWRLTALYNPPTDVHFYVDDRHAGQIDRKLPAGSDGAHRILTSELATSEANGSRLRWSEWRNRQYPVETY